MTPIEANEKVFPCPCHYHCSWSCLQHHQEEVVLQGTRDSSGQFLEKEMLE